MNWIWVVLAIGCAAGSLLYVRREGWRRRQQEASFLETAEQIFARLERETAALEQLLARCEARSAQLEQLLSSPRAEAPSAAVAPPAAAARPEEPRNFALALLQEQLRQQGARPQEEQQAAPAQSSRYDQACTLAASGFQPADIARRTGLGVAEVKLLLGLRKGEKDVPGHLVKP